MKAEYRLLLMLCGFAIIFAFIALMLVPQITSMRNRLIDLQVFEARARIASEVRFPYYEADRQEGLRILCNDEFFLSLANIRYAALVHGLDVSVFVASEVENFGMDVSETAVRVSLTGCFDSAIDYVHYLAGGVHNVRYLSIVNAETANFDVWFSIFHR